MSYRLFLDDERLPKNVTWIELPLGPWFVVRNYNDFVNIIKEKGLPEFVSFDHDLGKEHYDKANWLKFAEKDYSTVKEKTGYDCAKWLVEYCMDNNKPFPQYTVHSLNPIGKDNILSFVDNFIKHSQ